MYDERFRLEIAEKDLAFIKSLEVEWTVGDMIIQRDVKVQAGRPYILHIPGDRVIPIINYKDRFFYENLYAVNLAPISGYDGVYADSEEEALDLIADYGAEQVPDPDNPGQSKRRWPGLIYSWSEAMDDYDEDEQAVSDFFTGPVGNEGWLIAHDGNGVHIKQVRDDKVPQIPTDLTPWSESWTLDYVLDLNLYSGKSEQRFSVQDHLINEARIRFRDHIERVYGIEGWACALSDYAYDNPELFPARISAIDTMFGTALEVKISYEPK